MTDQPPLFGSDTCQEPPPVIENRYWWDVANDSRLRTMAENPAGFWRAELYIGRGECPWVLHDSYHQGTIISNVELIQSAREAYLPNGLILRRMDGAQWVIVTGEPINLDTGRFVPQKLLPYSPKPDEMKDLPLLAKKKRAKI